MKRPAVITLLVAALLLVCPMLGLGQTGATAVPDHVTLTWTGDTATTMTVTWRTDMSPRIGFVQYQKGDSLTSAAQLAKAKPSVFTTDLGDSQLFRAALTGLAPDTQYTYRVGDGKNWSKTHKFRTADPTATSFKFLVFADSQSTPPYTTWSETLHNAYKANPDARFFVNVGDLVDVGQNGAHWNAWFDAAAGVVDTIPVMATTGNHESGGIKDMRRPAYWNAQLAYPSNGPETNKNQAYSYDYANAHLVVLDSQQPEQKQYGDFLATEAQWLNDDLKASTSTWKFAFFHRAPYEVHKTRSGNPTRDAFCPTLEQNHVDVVFNGHDHGLARSYAIGDGKYFSKPSQGTVYYVCGRSGTKAYSDVEKKPWHSFFAKVTKQPNYLVVDVAGRNLTIKVVSQDGKLMDLFTIDKRNDLSSDSGLALPALAAN